MTSEHFDAIVIGSGMGGLTTASLLTQIAKQRVLVLEKHFKLGGFTHSFRRHEFEWDVGVHYVGQMQKGSLMRRMMDLVTGGAVDWQPMGDIYERYSFPGKSFEVPKGESAFRSQLIAEFPQERTAIHEYFRDIRKAQTWMNHWFLSKAVPQWLGNWMLIAGKQRALSRTQDQLTRFKDPLVRAILTAQWPDYGSPPDESAFGFHATVSADFYDGGYFPIGGSKMIAQAARGVIETGGGQCLVNRDVREIILDRGRAVGVRVIHKGKTYEYFAKTIVSNAGGVNTFTKMIPAEVQAPEREIACRVQPGISALMVFVGLHDDPRNHGFDDANYWIYRRIDHDMQARKRENDPDRIDGVFVSFGSVRDPQQTHHTAQIISFSESDRWKPYSQTQWMRRGEDYDTLKEKTMQAMVNVANDALPGLDKLIKYKELATPLTVNSFTQHPNGAVYGQPCNARRLTVDQWRAETSIPGLYLTGSDVGSPGVNGAMMGGAMTTARILGTFGLPRILMRAYR
jgi:phytoene dehydrogenase-like protein